MRLIDADKLKEEFPNDSDWDYPVNTNCYVCEMIDAQPTIEPERKTEWIPCSLELPKEARKYLVTVLDGVGRRTTVAPYQPRCKAWTMTGRMAYWKVIAWMPLPEPYEGGNDA